MAWTPTLKQIIKKNATVTFIVDFTDGIEIITKEFVATGPVDADWLRWQCKRFIAKVEAIYAYADTQATGGVDTNVVEVTTPAAENTFLRDLDKLIALTKGVDLGVVLDTDNVLVNLRASVRSDLIANPSWIKYLR